MKLSTDRILTTHVGSLPRPPDLLALLDARETGREFDQPTFETHLAGAVCEVVAKQVAVGIDSVCDGELGKISYTTYVRHRFSGIGAFRGGDNDKPPQTAAHRDLLDHPDHMQRLNEVRGTSWFSRAGGSVLHRAGRLSRPTAAGDRPEEPCRRLRRSKTGRSFYECGLARRADEIRARPLLP